MEAARSGQKRRWASNAGPDDDPTDILLDDLKVQIKLTACLSCFYAKPLTFDLLFVFLS